METFTYPSGFLSTFPHEDLPGSIKGVIQAHWDKLSDPEKVNVRKNLAAWDASGRKIGYVASIPVKMEHGV